MNNRVEEYRKKKGWSQEQLSEKSGVSRNTISSLETGTNQNVTYGTMENIANALNEKVKVIFFEK